jgi:hypothetical protein
VRGQRASATGGVGGNGPDVGDEGDDEPSAGDAEVGDARPDAEAPGIGEPGGVGTSEGGPLGAGAEAASSGTGPSDEEEQAGEAGPGTDMSQTYL